MGHHILKFSILEHAFFKILQVYRIEDNILLDAFDSEGPLFPGHVLVVIPKDLALCKRLKSLLFVAGVRFVDFSCRVNSFVDFLLIVFESYVDRQLEVLRQEKNTLPRPLRER